MKQESFERALHRWKPWLDSIVEGRKLLRLPRSTSSLQKMRNIAKETLTKLDFPACALFELYWLCCVFCDYETKGGFKFDKLLLPDGFPLPFGFKYEEYVDTKFLRERIKPPEVWDEADRKFKFDRSPIRQFCPPDKRDEELHNYPESDFIIVLPSDHATHKLVKMGRPTTTTPSGETLLD